VISAVDGARGSVSALTLCETTFFGSTLSFQKWRGELHERSNMVDHRLGVALGRMCERQLERRAATRDGRLRTYDHVGFVDRFEHCGP
jgi:hypothetical protein